MITPTGTTSTNATPDGYVAITGQGRYSDDTVSFRVDKTEGIHPNLYFSYIKKKFGVLERMRIDSRLKKLEKAFYKAIDNGQEALGEKFLKTMAREAKESVLYAKGIKLFIEKEDLDKHKYKIRGGHISDTKFEDYTRVVPKDVLSKKKKVEGIFDEFVIYHYWNEDVEDLKKMDVEEKSKMKDPVLFGIIKESDRLYHIASWDDDLCDLNFDEIADVLAKETNKKDDDFTIGRDPNLK